MRMRELLVASGNPGKVAEISEMLTGVPVRIVGLDEIGSVPEPVESGRTFAENAAIKATHYALASGLTALSDDSGLEVDALGGAPGVYSARYGGAGTSYDAKIGKLLAEIAAADRTDRSARFVCVTAVAGPDGRIVFSAEAECRGRIAGAAAGTGGFGYDPVFIPDGHSRTFAELPAALKDQISHRARAMRLTIPFLRDFLATLT